MPAPAKGPPERHARSGPVAAQRPGPRNRSLTDSTKAESTRQVSQQGAIALLHTCARQVDALAGLGSDALLHAEPLGIADMVRAVDTIGQRLGAAVAVLDLRGRP